MFRLPDLLKSAISASQMLLAGDDRQLVCNALLVTNRGLRKMKKNY
jgi:hypothetical protein